MEIISKSYLSIYAWKLFGLGIFIFLIASLNSACSCNERKLRIADFTIVSSRNVEIAKLQNLSKNLKAKGVEGRAVVDAEKFDEGIDIDGLLAQAIDSAVTKAGGDLMMNAVVYFIQQSDCKKGYMVKGDVIETMEDKYSHE